MDKKNSNQSDELYLQNLRHSCAHLLAAAVLELWPKTKPTIGPSIENGFYYDFDFGDVKISDSDLPKIETKMRELVKDWKEFKRIEVDSAHATKQFSSNEYKKELIEEFKAEGQKLTLYASGAFTDLCRGGHCERPDKELQFFKLLSVAGAYWRGDEKNPMLTRIYGTCFTSQAELDRYVWQQEEAKKRDHRKLGKDLKLFIISADVGSGFPLYLPNGFIIRRELSHWIMYEKERRGYQFVWTPHVAKSTLYRKSGHWQKYDAMFNPMRLNGEEYVVKPMNCPHHFQVYLSEPRSYRELPLRIAENATVYRNEKAGELAGLLRVRSLTQDDTHTFVRHDQISEEIDRILELATFIFRTFGFSDYKARISTRDTEKQEKYLGKPDVWDTAEKALVDAIARNHIESFMGIGEAAFYGPKIDIIVKDAIGREWQLSTIQLDFNQPENFDMNYVNEKGELERPAVIHIAILGSFERFLAILIEHYAGAFPLWLSPVQLGIIPIAERHNATAVKTRDFFIAHGIRAEVDDRNETMQAKVRNYSLQKIPYMAIIGDTERDNGSLAIRTRRGENLKGIHLDGFLKNLQQEIDHKT